MGFPRLRESMCGCTVETGSMILAWFGVVGSAVKLLAISIFYAFGHESVELYVKKHNPEHYEESMLEIKIILAFLTVVFTFALAINIMLLLGVHKRNHCLMMPWIILSGCGCALNLLFFGFHLLSALLEPTKFLLSSFVHGIFTAVGVYFFLIVYSFYHEVKDERQMNDSRFKPLGA